MSGLDNLNRRLEFLGGDMSGRFNKNKLNSLNSALKNSYQSTKIYKLPDLEEYTCLINPDKVKPDYDNKMISVSNEAELHVGDAFYWIANNTYWLVYLRELTETAYFRAYIRRCRNKLTINNVDYYVYIQGPTETDARWNQKAGIEWNDLNASITMFVTKTDDSLEFFKRFNRINLDGHMWQVVAIDSMSMEGIIEVGLNETFNNSMEDSMTVNVEPAVPASGTYITGESFVKPYEIQSYDIVNASGGTWLLSNTKANLTASGTGAIVEITSGRSGTFDIMYGNPPASGVSLTVTIESL